MSIRIGVVSGPIVVIRCLEKVIQKKSLNGRKLWRVKPNQGSTKRPAAMSTQRNKGLPPKK